MKTSLRVGQIWGATEDADCIWKIIKIDLIKRTFTWQYTDKQGNFLADCIGSGTPSLLSHEEEMKKDKPRRYLISGPTNKSFKERLKEWST